MLYPFKVIDSWAFLNDDEFMVEYEFDIHVAKWQKGRYYDFYGWPGENQMGYGVYYDESKKIAWTIFQNSDTNLSAKCSSLKKAIDTFEENRRDII